MLVLMCFVRLHSPFYRDRNISSDDLQIESKYRVSNCKNYFVECRYFGLTKVSKNVVAERWIYGRALNCKQCLLSIVKQCKISTLNEKCVGLTVILIKCSRNSLASSTTRTTSKYFLWEGKKYGIFLSLRQNTHPQCLMGHTRYDCLLMYVWWVARKDLVWRHSLARLQSLFRFYVPWLHQQDFVSFLSIKNTDADFLFFAIILT